MYICTIGEFVEDYIRDEYESRLVLYNSGYRSCRIDELVEHESFSWIYHDEKLYKNFAYTLCRIEEDYKCYFIGSVGLVEILDLYYCYIRSRPELCICEQSGIEMDEKEYNISRWNKHRENKNNKSIKVKKVLSEILEKNFGSYKRVRKKNIIRRYKHIKIHEESGVSLPALYMKLIETFPKLSSVTPQVLVEALETSIGFYLATTSNKTLLQIVLTFLMSIKSLIRVSSYNYLKTLIEKFEYNHLDFNQFIQNLKEWFLSWEVFRKNKFARSFCTLFSKIVTFILSPSLAISLDKVVENSMLYNTWNFFYRGDFLDGIVDTIVYLANAVDLYIKNGSFQGFISTTAFSEDIFESMQNLRNMFFSYKTGSLLEEGRGKYHEFLFKMSEFRNMLVKLKECKYGRDITEMNNMIKEVDSMNNYVTTIEEAKEAREMPYGFIVISSSGINKTHLVDLIGMTVLKSNSYNTGVDYTFDYNDKDKFQAGWANWMTFIRMEDSANAKPESCKSEVDPANFALKALGNAPHKLLSAEVDTKGTWFNRCGCLGMSSNSVTQNYHYYSKYPSTLWRRFRCVIIAEVKPEYRLGGDLEEPQIDYSRIPDYEKETITPNVWDFTVYKAKIQAVGKELKTDPLESFGKEREQDDNWYFDIRKNKDGSLLEKTDLKTLLKFIKYDSKLHFKEQDHVLKIKAKTFKEEEWEDGLPVSLEEFYVRDGYCCDTLFEEEDIEEDISINRQSGVSFDYLKHIVDYILSMSSSILRIKISKIINTLLYGKLVLEDLKFLLGNVVDEYISEFLFIVITTFKDYVLTKLENIEDLIPKSLETTSLGTFIHSKNRTFTFLSTIDYFINFPTILYNSLEISNIYLDYAYKSFWGLFFSFLCKIYFLRPIILLYGVSNYYHRNVPLSEIGLFSNLYLKFGNINLKSFSLKSHFNKFIMSRCEYKSRKSYVRKIKTPNSFRDEILPKIIGCFVFSNVIPALLLGCNTCYSQMGKDLEIEEIEMIDAKPVDKWYNYKCERMLDKPTGITLSTGSELKNVLNNNLLYISSNPLNNEPRKCVNAVMLCTSIILLPYHYTVSENSKIIECIRKDITGEIVPGNAKFTFEMNKSKIYKLKGDLCLLFTPNTGTVKDITNYFSLNIITDVPTGEMLYRRKDGSISIIPITDIMYKSNITNSPTTPLFQGYYGTSRNFDGLCGSPWIDVSNKFSSILGIHIGGNEERDVSASCLVDKTEVLLGISHLKGKIIMQSGIYEIPLVCYNTTLKDTNIHPKNVFTYDVERVDSIRLLGGISKRNTPTSKIVYTPIYEDVKTYFKLDYSWGPAPVKGIDGTDKKHIFKNFAHAYADKGIGFPIDILVKAKDSYTQAILSCMKKKFGYWKKEIRVLTDLEVVQGIDGKSYINGLNMSTAMGKYLHGLKKDHAEMVDGKWYFKDFVNEEYKIRKLKWCKGIRTFECFHAHAKSQPTPLRHILKGKARVFFMSDTSTQMLFRWLIQTTIRFWCLNSGSTECFIGINPHSSDWGKVVQNFDKIKGQNYIALDFSNFDIKIPIEHMNVALDILFIPMRLIYKSDNDILTAIEVMKEELLYPIVNLNGDVFELPGLLPSGVSVTSIVGCIVNSLYYRCAYYSIFGLRESRPFQEVVKLGTFGDDSIGKVHKSYKEFNVANIIKVLNKYKCTATNSSKDDKVIKFYKLEELEFLKRAFKYNRDYGTYVAPLNKESIFKSISALNPPKYESINSILGSNVDGSLMEMRFYGRNEYEEFRRVITKIMSKHNLCHYCRCLDINYDEMVEIWQKKNHNSSDYQNSRVSDLVEGIRHRVEDITNHLTHWFGWTQNNNIDIDERLTVLCETLGEECIPDSSSVVGKQVQVNITEQSGSVAVKFKDNEATDVVDVGVKDTRYRVSDDEVHLKDFLRRPLLIDTFEWGNTTMSRNILPWHLFLTNKRVINRVSNYKLLKGKLHIKIVVNGNGFFYGRAMAAYAPLFGPGVTGSYDELTAATALITQDLIQLSNLPHVKIDPAINNAGELVVPFFWMYDYFDMTRNWSASAGTEQVSKFMGALLFRQFVALNHANIDISTSLDTITISTYAWLEDVDLEAITHANTIEIVAQSGKEEDQTTNKTVSQVATSVANISGKLTEVPIIGQYAKAVSTAATMTSNVASALGYCEPVNVKEPDKFIRRPTSNMATCNTIDSVEKLTVDVKQQLSIDPRSVGLEPHDEMSINYIASRETFLTTFTWSDTKLSGQLLFNSIVWPRLMGYQALPPVIYHTALSGVSYPFEYWTGSIKFKFEIVCSNYHKGRLAIVYDPTGTPVTREDNVARTEIIDISDCKEYEFVVSNHQARAWLRNPSGFGEDYSSSTVFLNPVAGSNGTISVFVLNRLTSPNYDVSGSIRVMVTVSAGDDFKLAVPRGPSKYLTPIAPQSGEEVDNVYEDKVNQAVTSPLLQGDNKDYIGEEIVSIRTLLKRYSPYRGIFIPSTARHFRLLHPIHTFYRGVYSSGYDTTSSIVCTDYCNYFRCAFAGFRGSQRYKILVSNTALGSKSVAFVSRANVTTAQESTALTIGSTYRDQLSNTGLLDFFQTGGTVFDISEQNAMEFEVPYYSDTRMIPSKQRSQLTEFSIDGFCVEVYNPNTTNEIFLTLCSAGGEDYSLFFFTGWPRMYIATTIV